MTGQPTAGPDTVTAVSGRADLAVRVAMSAVVSAVAVIAAVISYEHAFELVSGHGEDAVTARLVPLTVDGLVVAASLVLLHAARSGRPAPGLARVLLVAGIVATVGANVAHGLAFGMVGALVAGWPALAFLGCSELALMLIRASGQPAGPGPAQGFSAARPDVLVDQCAGWLPDVLPPRPAPVRTVAALVDGRPDTVTAVVERADTRGPADVEKVRAMLAGRPDMSGAELARLLGVSARHGRRLRAAALG